MNDQDSVDHESPLKHADIIKEARKMNHNKIIQHVETEDHKMNRFLWELDKNWPNEIEHLRKNNSVSSVPNFHVDSGGTLKFIIPVFPFT